MKLSPSQKAALKRFKGAERNFDAQHLEIPFVDRICRSWANIKHTMIYDKSAAPADPYDCWVWLWQAARFDAVELGQVTGLQQDALIGLDSAIGNKLIYPDGTINSKIEGGFKFQFKDETDKIKLGLTER